MKNHFYALQRKVKGKEEMVMVRCLRTVKSSSPLTTDEKNDELSTAKTATAQSMVSSGNLPFQFSMPQYAAYSEPISQFNYTNFQNPHFQEYSGYPFMSAHPQQYFMPNSMDANSYFKSMDSCRPTGLVISKASSQDINGMSMNTNNLDMHNMMNNNYMNNGMMGQATNSLHILPRPPSLNIETNAKRQRHDQIY